MACQILQSTKASEGLFKVIWTTQYDVCMHQRFPN